MEFSNCVQKPAKSGAKPAMVDDDDDDDDVDVVSLLLSEDKCKSKSISVQVVGDDIAWALTLLQSTLMAMGPLPGQM